MSGAQAVADPLTALAELMREVDELRARVDELEQERQVPKRWLTAAEVGEYLDCSDRAVYERVRTGRIPAEAVKHSGRRVYFDRAVLDACLAGGLR